MRLRTFLQKRPLWQQRMAADLGINRKLMNHLEQGRKPIQVPLLELLALGLNVSLPELRKHL